MTRPCVLTPHAGEFARLRTGSGHDPAEDGDLAGGRRGAGARRPSAAATEWGQVVVLKGANTVIAAPDGSVAVAPFENPAMASGGTGDVLAGTDRRAARPGARRRSTRRGSGCTSTALAGEAVRERIGDAGLLASDLPDALPLGPATARADRGAPAVGPQARVHGSGRRAGTGRRRGGGGRRRGAGGRCGRSGGGRRGRDVELSAPRDVASPGVPPREPIEARLARAGLPPLLRSAWLEIDLDALTGNLAALREAAGPGVRVEPVVKADAYGHGAVEVVARPRGRGRGRPVGRDPRRGARAPRRRDRAPDPRPVPGPASMASPWRWRGGIALTLGAGEPSASILAAAAAAAMAGRPARARSRSTSRSIPASAGAASPPRSRRTPSSGSGPRRACGSRGVWTHLAAAERPPSRPRPGRHVPGVARAARRGGRLGGRCAGGPATPGRERRDPRRRGLALGRGPPRAQPVRPDPRRCRARGPAARRRWRRIRPVLSLHARPVRIAELPAGHGVSYGPSFVTTRPSRIATLPLGLWRRLAPLSVRPGVRAGPRRPRPAGRPGGDGRRDGRRHRRSRHARPRWRRVRADRRAGRRCGSPRTSWPRWAGRSATRWSRRW